MTSGTTHAAPAAAGPGRARPAWPPRAGLRLVLLYAVGRRIPAAIATIVGCAVALRIALIWHWDSYGALQLPLVFEAGCAAAISITAASPFGEPERVTGRWLPFLRLAAALTLTAAAVAALAAAGTGAHLTGGALAAARNLAGMTGVGLLCAAVVGGGLAWSGPVGYLVLGAYGLYTQWHGPALTTPWIWAARPPADLGAAVCAGVAVAIGIVVTTVWGARDRG
jgi:hypothetical protein